jgi:hypothetical protein
MGVVIPAPRLLGGGTRRGYVGGGEPGADHSPGFLRVLTPPASQNQFLFVGIAKGLLSEHANQRAKTGRIRVIWFKASPMCRNILGALVLFIPMIVNARNGQNMLNPFRVDKAEQIMRE